MAYFQRAPDSHSNGRSSGAVVALRPSFMLNRQSGQLAPSPLIHDNFVAITARGLQMPGCTKCTGKQIPVSKVFSHLAPFSVPTKDIHDLVMSGPQVGYWGLSSGIL